MRSTEKTLAEIALGALGESLAGCVQGKNIIIITIIMIIIIIFIYIIYIYIYIYNIYIHIHEGNGVNNFEKSQQQKFTWMVPHGMAICLH